MNSTNDDIIKLDCSSEDIKCYISLGINLLLGSITIISELLGASKCKINGFIDGIKKTISKDNIDDIEEYLPRFAN
jgi:hypothetical protein